MVSNISSVSSARFYVIDKPPDEEPVSDSRAVLPGVFDNRDRLEISNEAHTASINTQIITLKQPTREFMEVFSVKFWTIGLEEQEQ